MERWELEGDLVAMGIKLDDMRVYDLYQYVDTTIDTRVDAVIDDRIEQAYMGRNDDYENTIEECEARISSLEERLRDFDMFLAELDTLSPDEPVYLWRRDDGVIEITRV